MTLSQTFTALLCGPASDSGTKTQHGAQHPSKHKREMLTTHTSETTQGGTDNQKSEGKEQEEDVESKTGTRGRAEYNAQETQDDNTSNTYRGKRNSEHKK